MTRKDDANKELEWVACDYCGSNVTKVIYDFSPWQSTSARSVGVYTNPRLTSRSIRERLYDEQYWKAYEKEIERSLLGIQQCCRNWLNRRCVFLGPVTTNFNLSNAPGITGYCIMKYNWLT